MSAIGPFTFTRWTGRLHKARQRNTIIKPPPGVTGNGVSGGAFQADIDRVVTAVDVASRIAASTLRDQYRALPLKVYTCVDSLGETWNNVTLVCVYSADIDYLVSGRVRVTCTWDLLPESDTPAGSIT